MNQESAKSQIDAVLLPFIGANSEAEAQRLLEQIICNHAQPLVQNIIHYKLKASHLYRSFSQDSQEAEDLSSEVIVRLVRALDECKSSPQERPIVNLRSYVAVMAYNASDEYLRHKYPQRFSLKNKIKYLLTHEAEFALWKNLHEESVGGLAHWEQANRNRMADGALQQKASELKERLQKQFAAQAIERVKLTELLASLFRLLDSPVEIDELVSLVAALLGIRDAPMQTESETTGAKEKLLSSDPRERLDAAFDYRARLERVWQEVRALPIRQRAALLLNLKDEQGDSALALLPVLKIATVHQIAETLEMAPEALAAIWNDLPLEDLTIAERLGATRQQVINLRKCARERLARRLAMAGG